MPILFLILFVLTVLSVTFSVQARTITLNLLATAMNYGVGGWQQIIWPRVKSLLMRLAIIWIAFAVIMSMIGVSVNAPIAGILIGILFPIWSLLYIFRSGALTRIPYRIVTIIMILAIPGFLLGFWSPAVKASLDKRNDSMKSSLADLLDPATDGRSTSTGPQIISYIPSTTPAEIPLGKGKWKFSILADEKYIIPGMRVAVNTGKELPISPLGEGKSYYGGVLVNMSPNNSIINSDGRVVVTLKLPLGIQMVKGNAVMISFEPL